MVTAEQLKELLNRLEALKGYLELDKKAIEIQEEEEKTQAPEFWDDPKKAEQILKLIKGKKTWIGYIQSSNNENLPKIKQPVFDLYSSNSKLSDEISDKLNIIYAKDYNVQKDIILLCKRIFR